MLWVLIVSWRQVLKFFFLSVILLPWRPLLRAPTSRCHNLLTGDEADTQCSQDLQQLEE